MPAPKTAEISINIGGRDITVSYRNFSSLTIDRNAGDVCNKFVLQVLDDSAFEIENLLLMGNSDINIKYMDYDKSIIKDFTGSVIKIDTSFVDNRNMLTLEGFVGISVEDKYEKYSINWNKVPKFNWSSIFNFNLSDTDGSLLDMLRDNVANALSNLRDIITGDFNIFDDTVKEKIQDIFDNGKIFTDSNGNCYIETDSYKTEAGKPIKVKAEGEIIVPVRPSEIVRLIAEGGKFSSLLEYSEDELKKTSWYQGYTDDAEREIDRFFINKWYEKMGKIKGQGWKIGTIQKTDLVEEDLTQTKRSFLKYINETLVNKSVYTKSGKEYANFYLSFDNNVISYKRLSAKKNPDIKTTYVYYGQFADDGHGKLSSFNATLNILTSMITGGAENDTSSDISSMNLITGEVMQRTVATDVETDDNYTEYKNFGVVKYSPVHTQDSGGAISVSDVQSVYNKAQKLSYQAEITVEGACKLNPQDYIDIIIVPNNNGSVSRHHTSGTYYIMSINETIENGKMTSKLSLIKNINALGDTAIKEVGVLNND